MSPEDEEALRLMQEEGGHYDGDLRSEGDPDWFANGAQIELFGLQSEKARVLNGKLAEVIGYDNEHKRYRVRLLDEGTVKVVNKANMRIFAAPNPVRLGPQSPRSRGDLTMPTPTASVEVVPSVGTVRRAIDQVSQHASKLASQCSLRQQGLLGAGEDLCKTFMAVNVALDTCGEALEKYCVAYGDNEDLRKMGESTMQAAEDILDTYRSLRTWGELAKDEFNLTQYSIRRHGFVGTLRNEVVETGRDFAELGGGAAELAQRGAGAVPGIVRSATGTLGDVAIQGSQVAATATSGIITRSHQQARQAFNEQVVMPVKRTWHLVATAFLICYLVPLFGLRTYAPLNSVVANLGLVYGGVCIVCPPRWATSRPAKGGLLILWPLIMVVLPLSLHYWATNPPSSRSLREAAPQLIPQQVSQFWDRLSDKESSREEEEEQSPRWHPMNIWNPKKGGEAAEEKAFLGPRQPVTVLRPSPRMLRGPSVRPWALRGPHRTVARWRQARDSGRTEV